MEDSWSLVKTTLPAPKVATAGPILSRCCSIPVAEAATRIHTSRGILLRGIEKTQAERAAEELSANGIPAVAVPDSITTPPARPYHLRSAMASGSEFIAQKELVGETAPIPWDQVQVIAAGQVAELQSRRVGGGQDRRHIVLSTAIGLMTGVPVRLKTSSPMRTEERSDLRHWLDLLGGTPLQHYRIDGGRFNYASLLPQPAPVAEANFCYMVGGIVKMARAATSNVLPAHIAPDGSLALEAFGETYEYERLVTWLLALSRLGIPSPGLSDTGETTVEWESTQVISDQ